MITYWSEFSNLYLRKMLISKRSLLSEVRSKSSESTKITNDLMYEIRILKNLLKERGAL